MFVTALLVVPAFARAQEAAELADPGILPDSPFYFFKTFGEDARLFFTFNDTERVRLKLTYAGNRLAEAKAMQDRNDTVEVDRLLLRYREHVESAERDRERIRLRNITVEDIDAYMNQTTSRHIAVLTRVLENAPDSAKAGIRNALDNAEEHRDAVRTRLVEWATASGKNITAVIGNRTVSTQCAAAADCESLPHIMIVGHWECEAGRCRYAADESAGSPASNVGAGTRAGSGK